MEDLIASGVSIANDIELQDYDVAHYDKEFVLYLTVNGINVEKTWNDGTYYYGSANISFIHEDCNSKLLSYVDSKTIYEFGYDEDDGIDDECDDSEDDGYTVNGNPATKEEFDKYVSQFKHDEKPTTTKSTYRVNGKEVDKDTYEKALSDIEDRYLDNVRDMLLGYCEIMDEMNKWRSRLFRW